MKTFWRTWDVSLAVVTALIVLTTAATMSRGTSSGLPLKSKPIIAVMAGSRGTKGMACGVERQQVKTLADSGAANINMSPVATTIPALRQMKAPTDLHHLPDHRHAPVELTRYHLQALLVAFKQEADEDFHLVIADPANPSLTMIAEIPSVYCMDPGYKSVTGAEQGWVIKTFGNPGRVGRLKRLPKPVLVEIEGIGFFDFLHGQTGVAPNAVEIHPVLSITVPLSASTGP